MTTRKSQSPVVRAIALEMGRLEQGSSTVLMNGAASTGAESLSEPPKDAAQQTWRSPAINTPRVIATFWSFLLVGMNDATYGAILPYVEAFYNLEYTVVSLIFLSPFVGYAVSALLNNSIHIKFGQRGVALLGPLCHIVAYVLIALHPPYAALVVAFAIAGFGNGIVDAGWNAWIGAMANASGMLGILNGFYGVGAIIAPLIATSLITRSHLQWYTWYYVMLSAAVCELISSFYTFRAADGHEYRRKHVRTSDARGSRLIEALFRRPAARITWLISSFLVGEVGIEVALGGWIVSFMLKIRQATPFASGMTATGFWLGFTIGRFVIGFITPRIGEKLAVFIYLLVAISLQLVVWLVPQFYVSAISTGLQGVFIGPLYPEAVVVCTKLLPKHLHVAAVGFVSALGGGGGAIFPFIIGAIAQAKGVEVSQPILIGLLVSVSLIWLCLPRER